MAALHWWHGCTDIWGIHDENEWCRLHLCLHQRVSYEFLLFSDMTRNMCSALCSLVQNRLRMEFSSLICDCCLFPKGKERINFPWLADKFSSKYLQWFRGRGKWRGRRWQRISRRVVWVPWNEQWMTLFWRHISKTFISRSQYLFFFLSSPKVNFVSFSRFQKQ